KTTQSTLDSFFK
nr:Chain B, consensus FEN-1 peptide [synthetic construct]